MTDLSPTYLYVTVLTAHCIISVQHREPLHYPCCIRNSHHSRVLVPRFQFSLYHLLFMLTALPLTYVIRKGDVLSMGDLVEGFWEPQFFKGAGGLSAVQADKAIYINSNYSTILDDLAQWPDLSHIHKENFNILRQQNSCMDTVSKCRENKTQVIKRQNWKGVITWQIQSSGCQAQSQVSIFQVTLVGEKESCIPPRPSEVSGHPDCMGHVALGCFLTYKRGKTTNTYQDHGKDQQWKYPSNCNRLGLQQKVHIGSKQAFLRERCSYLGLKGQLNLLKRFQKL